MDIKYFSKVVGDIGFLFRVVGRRCGRSVVYLLLGSCCSIAVGNINDKRAEAYELPPLYGSYIDEDPRRFFTTLFDNELPITATPGHWSFRYNIKVDDLIDESYLRLPIEARYGLNNTTEFFFSSTSYLPNPFEDPSENSWGSVELGLKQRLDSFISDQWALAYGAKAKVPLERIPTADPRDQYIRYQPFLVTVYQPPSLPRWQFANQIRYDWIAENPLHEWDVLPRPLSTLSLGHAIIFTPKGEWRYSMEFEYETDELDGGSDEAFRISPGIGWFPRRNSFFERLPGDFDLGLIVSYHLSQLPIDQGGDDLSIKFRVRWVYAGKRSLSSTWKALKRQWNEGY